MPTPARVVPATQGLVSDAVFSLFLTRKELMTFMTTSRYQASPPRFIIVLLAGLVAFGPLSIDMYLPSLPVIAEALEDSEARVQRTISFFLIGFSAGMLLYGPLSDRLGRRRPLLFGIGLYVLASLGCFLSQSVDQLLFWRAFQALGGAAASVLARAIVRDLFPVEAAAGTLSLMHMVTMLATLVAPLLGSLLMEMGDWRSIFAFLAVYAILSGLAVMLWLPEGHDGRSQLSRPGSFFNGYLAVLGSRRAVGYMLCMGLSFAGMFAYLTASPFVYIDFFDVSPRQYAGLFGLNIVSVILFTSLNARLVTRLGAQRLLALGVGVAAVSGGTLGVVTFHGWGGLPAIVVGLFFFIGVTGMLGANSIASLMGLYPSLAGTAAGLAVAGQFGLGALMSALTSVLHDGTPLAMGVVVAGCGLGSLVGLLLTLPGGTARQGAIIDGDG